MKTETEVRRLILDFLKRMPMVGRVWQNNAFPNPSRRKKQPEENLGLPDIIGHFTSGKAFYIEVKCKETKGRLSPRQTQFLKEAREHNCFAIVAYSLDDVIVALSSLC